MSDNHGFDILIDGLPHSVINHSSHHRVTQVQVDISGGNGDGGAARSRDVTVDRLETCVHPLPVQDSSFDDLGIRQILYLLLRDAMFFERLQDNQGAAP